MVLVKKIMKYEVHVDLIYCVNKPLLWCRAILSLYGAIKEFNFGEVATTSLPHQCMTVVISYFREL